MEYRDLIHQRNRLLLKLLWFCVFLTAGVTYLNKVPMHTLLITVGIGSFNNLTLWLLIKKRKWIMQTMYICVVQMAVVSYFLISTSEYITAYLIVYLSLCLAALYQNFRPILLSAVFGLAFTNYFFFELNEVMFMGLPPRVLVSFNLFFILVTSILIMQSRFSEKQRQEMVASHQEVVSIKDRLEEVLPQIKDGVTTLTQFGSTLQVNAAATGQLSHGITVAFTGIAESFESQTENVHGINESVHSVNTSVQSSVLTSSKMRDLSQMTMEVTKQGNHDMNTLTSEMERVESIINTTVKLMNELNQQAHQIGEILTTVQEISSQTNLLALNAAIEAARAGEQGRSFSVVAQEVRKLAEHSLDSTEKIAVVLNTIQHKTQEVTEKVHSGQKAVATSKYASENVSRIFSQITENTQQVAVQAEQVESTNQALQQTSRQIADEVSEIAEITEQTAASVEEILASVEEQTQRMDTIVSSFEELEALTMRLSELVEKK